MSVGHDILMRMFGCPQGLLGRLGGVILARTNRRHAAWVIGLLDIGRQDSVLDIGCGPGVAVEMLAGRAHRVAGVDPSGEMLRQAAKRNAEAIGDGRVELRRDTADHLPFADASFDNVMALNSMQLWPDASAGLREVVRVIKPGGQAAFAFTAHSGQRREGVPELIGSAGFGGCRVVETAQAFCVLAWI